VTKADEACDAPEPPAPEPARFDATLRGVAFLLLGQFRSPVTLLLIATAVLSLSLGGRTDASIILVIVLLSAAIGFRQEYRAAGAVAALLKRVSSRATVVRGGERHVVPVGEIVPCDVVLLTAGTVIPGDGVVTEANGLFVDEAALTGETFPAEKQPAPVSPGVTSGPEPRESRVFLGTHVVSGSGAAVIAAVGRETEFGRIGERLRLRPPETAFERGLRRFGTFLVEVTLLLVLAIFAVNAYLGRSVLESLLFALALAVGLTPQLLPAVIGVTLAAGARRMADRGVIVKRLSAIEDFGGMTVLCTDKTGTLTEGQVRVEALLGADGRPSGRVTEHAAANAALQAGFPNPIDEALRSLPVDLSRYRRLGELPYDFGRRRLSVLAETPAGPKLITKGSFDAVLAACTRAEAVSGTVDLPSIEAELRRTYDELTGRGFRTLGVAYRDLPGRAEVGPSDEADLTFSGFLVLDDPPKPGAADAIVRLAAAGVRLKVITGDSRRVAAAVAGRVGLRAERVLTGEDFRSLTGAALARAASETDIFAEVTPDQKEGIVRALKRRGEAVGYLGDGINDAAALHAADVGVSVDSATDVAREAADLILLRHDLGVLADGVAAGRETFANTLKYVFLATSANFGNMLSVAGASLVLPFLPLLPGQILLANLLTDFPEMTIAGDRVDAELVSKPRRWDVAAVRRFMLVFGPLSSAFDGLTFYAMWKLAHGEPGPFRSGWFVESVASAALVVLVVRTRRPFWKSLPASPLALTTATVAVAAVALPYTPAGPKLGLPPLPPGGLAAVAVIVAAYVASAEAAKRIYYRWTG
jgi:Mg2+-importing ATPase